MHVLGCEALGHLTNGDRRGHILRVVSERLGDLFLSDLQGGLKCGCLRQATSDGDGASLLTSDGAQAAAAHAALAALLDRCNSCSPVIPCSPSM